MEIILKIKSRKLILFFNISFKTLRYLISLWLTITFFLFNETFVNDVCSFSSSFLLHCRPFFFIPVRFCYSYRSVETFLFFFFFLFCYFKCTFLIYGNGEQFFPPCSFHWLKQTSNSAVDNLDSPAHNRIGKGQLCVYEVKLWRKKTIKKQTRGLVVFGRKKDVLVALFKNTKSVLFGMDLLDYVRKLMLIFHIFISDLTLKYTISIF